MKVLLRAPVVKLGKVGDLVDVKAGYARNFLIPMGKAVMATPNNIADFEKRRAEFEKQAQDALDQAKARAEVLSTTTVTVTAQAGEGGKLYGSIGSRDITEAAVSAGLTLEKSEIRLPEGPIRQLGEHEVTVHLHSEVNTTLMVNVIPDTATTGQ